MKVIAIDITNRPNEIPISKWPVHEKEYTVVESIRCNVQGGLLGFKLAEIDLTGCEPYMYFSYTRFMPVLDIDDVAAIERETAVA